MVVVDKCCLYFRANQMTYYICINLAWLHPGMRCANTHTHHNYIVYQHYITLHYNLHFMQCQPQPVHKLKFKFKPGSVPAYLGLSYIGCSTCDEALKNDLQFGPIKRSNPNPNESSKRTNETLTSRQLWTSFPPPSIMCSHVPRLENISISRWVEQSTIPCHVSHAKLRQLCLLHQRLTYSFISRPYLAHISLPV